MLLGTGIGAVSGGFAAVQSVGFNKLLPVVPNSPPVLNAARFRGIIDESKYLEEMKASGFDQVNASMAYESARALNDTNELIRLYFRQGLGDSPEANHAEYLRLAGLLGLNTEVAERAAKAAEQIGTPQDLVRFLVREVFTPELREKLQLDAEYPPEATAQFRRLGVAESYARNIWAAHWELPSIGQLETAYHRYAPESRSMWASEVEAMGLNPDKVETTKQDIADLLKFSDVGTYYRDRIMATLYSDLGQIQLRWLVRFRFSDFTETTYRLQRRGLPEPLARTVAQVFFCVQSISDWKDGIKAGILTWEDVLTELDQWEIDQNNVRRIVQLKVAPDTLAPVEDERKIAKSTVLDAYDLGIDDAARTKTRLQDLGYSADQASFILDVHVQEKKIRAAKETEASGLTKQEVKRALRAGKMSANKAIQALQDRGVSLEAARIIVETEGK